MIRDDNPSDAMLDGEFCILRRQYSLDDERQTRQRAHPVENVPAEFAADLIVSTISKVCLQHMCWSAVVVPQKLLFASIIGRICRDHNSLIARLFRTLDELL